MNRICKYKDVKDFLHENQAFLKTWVDINNLMLGLSVELAANGAVAGGNFISVKNSWNQPIGCAIQTSPERDWVLWAPPECHQGFLKVASPFFVEAGSSVPGFIGPKSLVHSLCQRLRGLGGRCFAETVDQGFFRLDKLVSLPFKATGRLRLAQEEEQPLMVSWMQDFSLEAIQEEMSADAAQRRVAQMLANQRLYVWEKDGAPVSVAAYMRPVKPGVAIGHVFTPNALRGRGYSTHLVASLSEVLLARPEYAFCCLFTDLANPVSNHIYQKMGYRKVANFATYRAVP